MEKEIKNFELRYDGMYHITWKDGEKERFWYVNISLIELLRMIEIEGLTFEQIYKAQIEYKPLKFEKATLKYTIVDGKIDTYGFFDGWLGNSLLEEGFTVELFMGDSLKNHVHDTLMGYVELVDDKLEKLNSL